MKNKISYLLLTLFVFIVTIITGLSVIISNSEEVILRKISDQNRIIYWVFIASFILLLVLVISFIIYKAWEKKFAIGIYADPISMELNTPIFNIVNGKMHRHFWTANIDEMKLYVGGHELKTKFFKEYDNDGKETGVMKVALTHILDNGKNMYYVISGSRHDDFQVSYDNGETLHKVRSIHDHRLSKQLENYNKWKEEGKVAPAIFLIDELNNTSSTLRYDAIVPKGSKFDDVISKIGEDLIMYYQVDKKMYPIKTKYLGRIGTTYSWDLVGLEPGTIYANLHWSVGAPGNKHLTASAINYGITKDEDENFVSMKNSKLPSAPEGEEGYPLPPLEENVKYLGRDLILRHNTISAQKHLQRDINMWVESRMLSQKINQYLFDWYGDLDVLHYEDSSLGIDMDSKAINIVDSNIQIKKSKSIVEKDTDKIGEQLKNKKVAQ